MTKWVEEGRWSEVNFQRVLKDQFLSPQDPLSAELAVADGVGRLMHFWGFKRPMGRIWTFLYLSSAPLSAADLSERLQMSSGAVSMALTELEKWGVVARTWVPGERRDYFIAEPSVWKMVQRVLRERELGVVQDFRETLKVAIQALTASTAGSTEERRRQLNFKLEKLGRLESLARTGEMLLRALVSGDTVDPRALMDAARSDVSLPTSTHKNAHSS